MSAVFREQDISNARVAGITSLARPAGLLCLVLALAACGSVQAPPRPVEPAGGTVTGVVLGDDYALSVASWGAEDAGPHGLALRGATPLHADAGAADGGAAPDAVPGQVLVQYRTDPAPALDRTGRALRAAAPAVRSELVEVAPGRSVAATLERLARDPAVVRATPNYYLHPTALPDDPRLGEQWALAAAGVPEAWRALSGAAGAVGAGGDAVVVAVVDTGFDLDHEDLAGRFLPGYDFCATPGCGAVDADPGHGDPANWHGTHVAGVVAAAGDNGVGVSGVAHGADVRILPVKVFDDHGAGATTAVLIDALRWAAGLPVADAPVNRHPARIINLSLAGAFPSEVLQEVLDEVRAAGALVVAATGNDGVGRVLSPAAADGVVGVGASNRDFRRSCFSNYGVGALGPGGVDLVAPGGEANGLTVDCGVRADGLIGTVPGDRYATAYGTSVAAPMASGAAALILAQDPALDVGGLEARLSGSAYFDAGYMDRAGYGAGVLRADRALGRLGPGDTVEVELLDADEGVGPVASVVLGLTGTSTAYAFAGVPAGAYELRATAPDAGAPFERVALTLQAGEARRVDLVLQGRE